MADSGHLRDSSKSILNIIAKRLNSPVQFWPFPLNPGWHSHTKDPLVFVQVAFTWQEWFPLHSSISEKPYIYNICMHFIMFVTLKWADSQSCNLFGYYIWENKFISLFLFHELDIWNVYFIRNISIYQADGFGKLDFPVAPTKRYHPPRSKSSQNTRPNSCCVP